MTTDLHHIVYSTIALMILSSAHALSHIHVMGMTGKVKSNSNSGWPITQGVVSVARWRGKAEGEGGREGGREVGRE